MDGIFYQATESTLVFPMVLASPISSLTRFGVLRGLLGATEAWWNRGIAASAISSSLAFLGETTFFSTASRGLTHMIKGPVAWDFDSIAHDWKLAGLNLALLKSAGFAGRKAMQWHRGLDTIPPQLWSQADHRALFWTGQASAYLGLVSSLGIQERIYPSLHQSNGNIWLDALGTHIGLGLGGAAGRWALGASFQVAELQLAAKAHHLDQMARSAGNYSGPLSNLAFEAVGGGNGHGKPEPIQVKKSENIWAVADHSGQELEGSPETPRFSNFKIADWDVARPKNWIGNFQNDGEAYLAEGKLSQDLVRDYGKITGNEIITHSGFAPTALPFLSAFPVMFDLFLSRMLADKGTSVIHVKESSTFHHPIRSDADLKIRVTPKILGKAEGRQVAKIKIEIFDPHGAEGENLLAEGLSTLMIQPSVSGAETIVSTGVALSDELLAQLPKEPVMEHQVSLEEISEYAGVSGDYNPIHMLDEAAMGRGLPGRIAHGMLIQNLANRALFFADPQRDPAQPPRFSTDFKGIVRPGDKLRFFVEPFEEKETTAKGRVKVTRAGNRVTVLNQANQLVLQMVDEAPGEQARRVVEGEQVKYLYRKIEYNSEGTQEVIFREVPIDAPAGIQRVRDIAKELEIKSNYLCFMPELPDQPSNTLGVSSGYGLHSAIQEIAIGKLRRGIGVFYEPLGLVAAKNPVQISALENVEGLRVLAAEKGVDYPLIYTDAVLPKGDGTVRKLSPKYHAEVQRQRALSEIPDLKVTNSVAFSLHIGPLPGVIASPYVPTLNFMKNGLLEMIRLKEPNEEKGRVGTLIPMGENIGAIWQEHQAYYGPRSISLMATWAGGSQNIEVMPGIYGDGYLGKGKKIGEDLTLLAHMASRANGYAQGYFKVVRLPAFNSRALWMIPSGPLMGLISKRVLDKASPPEFPLYKDLTDLVPEVFYKIGSGIHQREHALAQIELDSAENTFMPQIKKDLDMIYQRVADELPGYREAYEATIQKPWDGKTFYLSLLDEIPNFKERFQQRHGREYKPFKYPDGSMRIFDMDATQRIVQGIVPENWQDLMPAPDSVADRKKLN